MDESSSRGETSSSNAVRGQAQVHDDEPFDLNATGFPMDPTLSDNYGRQYEWQEIIDGTQNFQTTKLLGSGNFGEVYLCQFSKTNEDAAVKIQNPTNLSGHDEFLAEVKTLHAADNANVIRLLGICYCRTNRAIVYEYMPNRSLDRHIFVNWRQGLDWSKRMKIAAGVAQGLLYIHYELKVIHGDVNAGNILLDADFVPKLSDFGSATEITTDQNGDEQERKMYSIKGTPGWMAPETKESRLVSTKSDVYSYGVFLFVLFTGRKPIDPQKSPPNLINWVKRAWTRLYTPVDVALGNKYSVEGLKKIYQTARMCLDPNPHERPVISTVERMVLQAAAFPVQKLRRRNSL